MHLQRALQPETLAMLDAITQAMEVDSGIAVAAAPPRRRPRGSTLAGEPGTGGNPTGDHGHGHPLGPCDTRPGAPTEGSDPIPENPDEGEPTQAAAPPDTPMRATEGERPMTHPDATEHSTHPDTNGPHATGEDTPLPSTLRLRNYGVLGAGESRGGPPPDGDTVVVDPAGLRYIQ